MESADPSAVAIDKPNFLNFIPKGPEFRQKPHPFGNIVADTPEIDQIAANAGTGRTLYQRHLKAIFFQPVGERWPSNSNSRNQNR